MAGRIGRSQNSGALALSGPASSTAGRRLGQQPLRAVPAGWEDWTRSELCCSRGKCPRTSRDGREADGVDEAGALRSLEDECARKWHRDRANDSSFAGFARVTKNVLTLGGCRYASHGENRTARFDSDSACRLVSLRRGVA